jgi:threonine/homoserine/homoserine lactone efflux protein
MGQAVPPSKLKEFDLVRYLGAVYLIYLGVRLMLVRNPDRLGRRRVAG